MERGTVTITEALVRPLTDMSATELVASQRRGEVSASEVVEAHVRRIEAVNPRLNAVVVPLFEEARAHARAADEARARGTALGPLHGVPITIKEQFKVVGTPTTLGLVPETEWRADVDGPLVARLRRAGAIVLGKTNVSQFLIYHESDNPVYGKTLNPWNPERSPGGSSGGEAAIVAAAGAALGLGGDLGGSLRVPAHFCGVHTLKPTAGRLTNEDNRLDLFEGGQMAILPQQGLLARRVEDLRLGMRVLAPDADRRPDEIAPSPWPDGEVHVEDLRIGFYEDDGFFPAAPSIRRAVREAAEALRFQGASVQPFSPPDVREALRLFLAILVAKPGPFRRATRSGPIDPRLGQMVRVGKIPRPLRPLVARALERRGERRTAQMVRWISAASKSRYPRLVRELENYRRRALAEVESARMDAILCPPYALPALTHGASEHLFPAASYAVLYNVLGWPAGAFAATCVRPGEESARAASEDPVDRAAAAVERGSAGLPVAVQVVARPWREDIVMAVMAALEEAFSAKPDYPPCLGPSLKV